MAQTHLPAFQEILSNAPDVYQLFHQLGDTGKNPTERETPVEQKKAIMSLCMHGVKCKATTG